MLIKSMATTNSSVKKALEGGIFLKLK